MLLVVLFHGLAVLGLSAALPPALIWADRFDTLDLNVWSHLVTAWGGGNDEFQYYRNNRKNSYVKNGKLHIRPTFTADEHEKGFLKSGTISEAGCNYDPCSIRGNDREILPPVFSARLSTMKSFAFRYGRVEVRAKMPRGDWIWPAIWLLPESVDHYGGWPTGGEIDMVEIRSNKDYKDQGNNDQGINRMGSTIHFGPRLGVSQMRHWEKILKEGDFSDRFHTFGLEWNNSSMKFTVDGEPIGDIRPPQGGFWEMGNFQSYAGVPNPWSKGTKMAPFDQKFYLVLNVAVGGKYFPDGWKSAGKPRPWSWSGSPRKEFWRARNQWSPTWDRPEMVVDHVLVYGWD